MKTCINRWLGAGVAAWLLVAPAVARAGVISVTNSGFSDKANVAFSPGGGNAYPAGQNLYRADAPNWAADIGWTPAVSSSAKSFAGVYRPSNFASNIYTSSAVNGSNMIFMYAHVGAGYQPASFEGTVSQVTAKTLQPLESYTLTVAIGDPAGTPFFSKTAIRLYAGSLDPNNLATNLLAEKEVSAAQGNAPSQGAMQDYTLTFDASSPNYNTLLATYQNQALIVVLYGQALANDFEADFDDVRFSFAAVPEPASLGLVAAGGVLLLRRRV